MAESSIQCVLLTSFDAEFSFLRSVLRFAGIRVNRAESLEEADFLLMVTGATVLLSDVAMAGCSWRCAMERVRDFHPLVAMLLIADPVDEPFIQDAFTLGACGVLWKPIPFDGAAKLIRVAHEASRERAILREEGQCARAGAGGGVTLSMVGGGGGRR